MIKLKIKDISRRYRTATGVIQALDHVSLEIKEGEFVCLLGPSGCGKTTFLNMIAGLDFPDEGQLLEDDEPIIGPGNDRMVMFQEPALFPWLNVLDNVLFGLKLKHDLSARKRLDLALSYLKLVGMEKYSSNYIHELSGGMKQRVALARALAPNPKVLLMDEPFAALDALTREQFYIDIQNIWQLQRKTIVFVTHNVAEAVCLGDRVILFSPSPGRNREEFHISLERPRDIRSVEVAQLAFDITGVLRTRLKSSIG